MIATTLCSLQQYNFEKAVNLEAGDGKTISLTI